MPSKGISIHIGLNHVDPAAYNGWDGALSGCINDANDMNAIAEELGYSATLMTDSDATADNVVAAIGRAASELTSNDILFISYSGHGSQVADVNGDDEDGKDETWVLWDRELVDDELYALWAQFEAGVRIIMLSDSCHSGTMARMAAAYAELGAATKGGLAANAQLRTALAQVLPTRAPAAKAGMRPAPRAPEPRRFKTMPSDVRAVVSHVHAKANAARQYLAGPSERTRAAIGASVILISGCQDYQLSLDGSANGLFTEKLKVIWNDGTFSGSYADFAKAIIAEMPVNQQPNYYTVGAPNPAFEAQNPFTVASPKVTPATTATPTTSPTSSASAEAPPAGTNDRPVLKRGAEGPYVKLLHDYLRAWDFKVAPDDDSYFGPRTESAVRSFQAVHELEASGVVDRSTWDALG